MNLKDFLRQKMSSNNKALELYKEVKKLVRFSRDEFECKCGCGQAGMDLDLIFMVEILRHELERLLNVTIIVEVQSGNRCIKHNSDTPGATFGSYHVRAMAGDFKFKYAHNDKYLKADFVYKVANKLFPHVGGIGEYSNRIHLDSRRYKARWKS